MAHLDRFLQAMTSNRAGALVLAPDDVARFEIDGVPRPVTKQPLNAAQLLAVLREIAPAESQRALEDGRAVTFDYANADGRFRVAVGSVLDGQSVRVEPAAATPAAASATTAPGANSSAAAAPRASGAIAIVETATGDDAAREEVEGLLRILVEQSGSDLHLRVGEPPILRIHGEMARMDRWEPLTTERIEAMLRAIMPPRNREEYHERNDTDFAHEIEGVARFRANALRERKGAAAVFRVIPSRVVTVEELGLSDEVQRLCMLTKGLVLVTGPTGSGKSTTLCGLIDLVNRTRTDHVITIEDPIEFVHPNKKCVITQRQVGVHTGSFKAALRAALREDPDIILVGELRDLETVSIAIETAETGHLVFGTLHTTTAVSTVDRIIDQFPSDRQEQIRVMLSESLKGVISQVLCKKVGGGRVAAREILLAMPSVANLIREGKTFQLPSILQTSRRLGMITMNDALMELVEKKQVEPPEAYMKATDKIGFINALKQRGHDTSFLDATEVAQHGAPGGGKADGGARVPPRTAAGRA